MLLWSVQLIACPDVVVGKHLKFGTLLPSSDTFSLGCNDLKRGASINASREAIEVNETDKGLEEFPGDLNRSLDELLREPHESRREIARLRAENQDL